jgi:predicted Zn-ribbon and HTH transcriptional regulator
MVEVVKKITVKMVKCPKCGHEWIPRIKHPRECPRCKVRLD